MSSLCARTSLAQNNPHLGYVYPAGGQAGTQMAATLGGQYLGDAAEVLITGQGVQASIGKHKKPLTMGEANDLREKIDQVRDKLQADGKTFDLRNRRGAIAEALAMLKEKGVTEEDLERLEEFAQRRDDEKRQLNPAIEEALAIDMTLDPTAPPGRREIRLKTAVGVSNPIIFYVGTYPEKSEIEPNDIKSGDSVVEILPAVLNGQIMPGDVDRFRFAAKKGDKLVFVAMARKLVPYLADAVPGWFQATLALYDENGREVAYGDDFQFDPDPVVYFRIPQDGNYELEIRDSIYRGREDFVYRVTLGELPFITSVYPLGVQSGKSATLELHGWNLPEETLAFDASDKQPGSFPVSVTSRKLTSNDVSVVIGDLPEMVEQEPNNDLQTAPLLKPPIMVNGRIDQPGDWDVYRFDGRAGGQVIAQVMARRLNSPLDSLLKLTDAEGKQIMLSDDLDDPGSGLTTHHADSQLHVTLPADGAFICTSAIRRRRVAPSIRIGCESVPDSPISICAWFRPPLARGQVRRFP